MSLVQRLSPVVCDDNLQATQLFNLPSEILCEILKFLDGRSLLACIEASVIFENEVSYIKNIWKQRCEQEIPCCALTEYILKNDCHGYGLNDGQWYKIYYYWVRRTFTK